MSSEQNEETYITAVQHAVICAQLLALHDVPALLRAIERSDAIAPLIDPTLWINARERMYEHREFLRAALPLYRLGKELLAKEGQVAATQSIK